MIDKPLRNYLAVALLVAAVLMGGRIGWQEAVKVGCLPEGGIAPPGLWMDGCASDEIGSYGLDVLWFGLDPKAVAPITNAKVLIFGDSRMLTAASDGIASAWFAARNIPMYLLAFAAGEQSGFADRLIGKLKLHPEMVVFDADPYFTGEQSIPAQAIANDPAGEEQTSRATKALLDNGPVYCRYLGWLCGRTQSFFRRYSDGTVVHELQNRVWFNKNQAGSYPVTRPGAQDTSHYATYLENARALLTKLGANPKCAVFTSVPNTEMDDTLAKFLAQKLGGRVVAPWLDGLSTSDHYHLDPESSRAWSAAFLAGLQPVVRECIGRLAESSVPPSGASVAGLK